MCAPRTSFALLIAMLALTGCLESNQLDVSSQADYGPQGLSVTAEDVIEGGLAKITVSLNYLTPRDVRFHLRTVSEGAAETTDYLPIDGDFIIPSGSYKMSIPLETFTHMQPGTNRALRVEISEVANAVVLKSQAGISIGGGASLKPRLKNIETVNVSGKNVCATEAVTGNVFCWGDNTYGQSTGMNFNKYPSGAISFRDSVVAPPHPVKLTSNADSPCALYADGRVYCWGYGGYGNLGTSFFGGISPVQSLLSPADSALDVATGDVHTTVVFSDGTVKSKGYGGYKALGDGSGSNFSTFVTVAGLPGPAKKVAVSNQTSCAITAANSIYCWGRNSYGEVAKAPVGTAYPTAVDTGIANARALAAGPYHYCALLNDGTVKCWGNNSDGQIGFSSGGSPVVTPTLVVLPSPAVQIAASNFASCALLDSSDIWCWGYNGDATLGDGTITARTGPVKVAGLSGQVHELRMGGRTACVIVGDQRELKCWGSNYNGTVLAETKNMSRPMDPVNFVGQKVNDIVISQLLPANPASQQSICAVLEDGQTQCAGANDYLQLGRGSASAGNATAALVTGLGAGLTKAIEMSSYFSCALLTAGGLKCWGINQLGQIGNGGVYTTLIYVSPGQSPTGIGTSAVKVASAFDHSCAVMNDGTVRCWGKSTYGEGGSCGNALSPVTIAGVSNAVSVAVGSRESCAVGADGSLKCWGGNGNGLFGNGDSSSACVTSAVTVPIEPVKEVVIGALHACALTKQGGVRCWGENVKGQLGQDGIDRSLSPTRVYGLESGVTAISAGHDFTCALLEDGGVKCWGDNSASQLGVLSIGPRSSFRPVTPIGLGVGIAKIHLGSMNGCAVTQGGYPKCWGSNSGDLQALGCTYIAYPTNVSDNQTSF